MNLAAEQRWNEQGSGVTRRADQPRLVHERVERHARATPQATALRFREATLDYGELNRRANQLGHRLLGLSVGRGCRVVVSVEPGFDIVVALLGILKAGAVYVPLDPSYPAARIKAILADTRPELVITQRHLCEQLPLDGIHTLCLDSPPPGYAEEAEANLEQAISVDQTAYVYYTSGTTGTPKGVMGTHANLCHYVDGAMSRYGFGPDDVMPAIARFGFSISMFELIAPLVAGGTLVLLERKHVLDPARLARTLSEVTLFHMGPSLLKGLVAHVRRTYSSFSAFGRVRHASSGGDMVPPELLEALKEIFAHAEVFVIYGCSEISCLGTTYAVPRDRRITTTYVGRPFDDVAVRVLDAAGKPVPVGVVGEIHFAGKGVTQGYLSRPELSAEKFVELEGRRFYRTGDHGRWSRDGLLELLGRSDFQIKVRGMRVELGEVEQHLRRAPLVRDAVAAPKDAADGEKLLVAYVVLEPDAGDGAASKSARLSAVRKYLLEQLPDYMVPAVYVELDALPLNHNLKIDRRALPEPTEADFRALSAVELREPVTSTERTLARLFREVLDVGYVGLDDNFYELGGHSLLSLKLCAEVEATLGVRLEGMDVLREPLEVLAGICDRALDLEPHARETPRVRPAAPGVECFHFGPEQSLYGVLHGGAEGAERAALIAGPVGQEQVRARFVLARLAKTLAAQGVPTLFFDYFATGDSLGSGKDLLPGRWQRDIASAHAELERRTGGARITAVGVRLGALLLGDAARELALERLVLWDPVHDGEEHFAELDRLERAYERSIAHFKFWSLHKASRTGELLGTHYPPDVRRELEALELIPLLRERGLPTRWLATSQPAHEGAVVRGLGGPVECRVACVDFDCSWHDLSALEDIIPDAQLSASLARQVLEVP
jgi:amino acid adenylation domain-containing protein